MVKYCCCSVAQLCPNLIQMSILSTAVGKKPLEEMEYINISPGNLDSSLCFCAKKIFKTQIITMV